MSITPKKKRRWRKLLTALAVAAVLAGSLALYGYVARQNPERMAANQIVKLERTKYIDLPAMRFIGMAVDEQEWPDRLIAQEELLERRDEFMPVLGALTDYAAEIAELTGLCTLRYNNSSDEEIYLAGKYMRAGTPVPEGFGYYDIPATKIGLCLLRGEYTDLLDQGGWIIWNKLNRGKYSVPEDRWFFSEIFLEDTVMEEGAFTRMGFMNPIVKSK